MCAAKVLLFSQAKPMILCVMRIAKHSRFHLHKCLNETTGKSESGKYLTTNANVLPYNRMGRTC